MDGISLAKWNDTAVRAAITSIAYNAVNTVQFSNVSVTLSDFYVEAGSSPLLTPATVAIDHELDISTILTTIFDHCY